MTIDPMDAVYLLGAALIALFIRLYDTPATELVMANLANILKTLAGSAIAVVLGAWILAIDVSTPEGFIEIVALGIGGMAVVKAMLNVKEEVAPS